MRILQDDNSAKYQIRGCGIDYVQINDTRYTSSVIIRPDALLHPWEVSHFKDLTLSHLITLLANETILPEIVLLGTGQRQHVPSDDMLRPFYQRGIGFEFMSTESACRTYAALSAEGRHVVACLIIESL